MTVLSDLCAASGLDRSAIARAIGVSRGTLWGWVVGQRPVPARHVAGLARVLGVATSRIPARAPLKSGRQVVWRAPEVRPEPARTDDAECCWVCTRAPCVCHLRWAAA